MNRIFYRIQEFADYNFSVLPPGSYPHYDGTSRVSTTQLSKNALVYIVAARSLVMLRAVWEFDATLDTFQIRPHTHPALLLITFLSLVKLRMSIKNLADFVFSNSDTYPANSVGIHKSLFAKLSKREFVFWTHWKVAVVVKAAWEVITFDKEQKWNLLSYPALLFITTLALFKIGMKKPPRLLPARWDIPNQLHLRRGNFYVGGYDIERVEHSGQRTCRIFKDITLNQYQKILRTEENYKFYQVWYHEFNYLQCISLRRYDYLPDLHVAAYYGRLDLIDYIVANGGPWLLNLRTAERGITPLHVVIYSDQLDDAASVEVAKKLLSLGVSLNQAVCTLYDEKHGTTNGHSIWHVLEQAPHKVKLAKFLLEQGETPDLNFEICRKVKNLLLRPVLLAAHLKQNDNCLLNRRYLPTDVFRLIYSDVMGTADR